jgi:hypothetical protein
MFTPEAQRDRENQEEKDPRTGPITAADIAVWVQDRWNRLRRNPCAPHFICAASTSASSTFGC